MKPKLFSFFLVLVASVGTIFASDTSVDGIWYDFNSSTLTASVTYRGSSGNAYKDEYSGSVVIPASVTYSGKTYSVTSIGNSAFRECTGLTSVTIPNSVTSIGNTAFYYCSSLTSVTIGNGVTSIGESVFYNCTGLTSVTIPNSVTSIGESVFYNCTGLTSVTIPNSVTSIGERTFWGCTGLTSVTIPNSVTSIGNSAFSGCSGLTSVHINDLASWCGITFAGTSSNPLYYAKHIYLGDTEITDLVIPNSVTEIKDYAFYGCTGLNSVTISSSVTSIGNNAFLYCSGLTSVTIPNSVTSIGEYAFSHCNGLTSIIIPNGVTSIEGFAFYGCIGLTSVTIGNNVTYIGGAAFYGCRSLTSVTCLGAEPALLGTTVPVNVGVFNASLSVLYVPCGALEAYRRAWSDYSSLIQYPVFEFSISGRVNLIEAGKVNLPSAFCDGTIVTAVPNYGYHFIQWSDGVTDNPRSFELTQDTTFTAEFAKNIYQIALNANTVQGSITGLSQAEYLDSVSLTAEPNYGYHFTQWSDGVTDNPRTIELTQDTTFIAEFFYDRTGSCGNNLALTWAYDPEEKKLVISGNGALEENKRYGAEAPTEMQKIIIEEGVTSVGDSAFYNICGGVTTLALPNSVTEIGDYALAGLTNRKFNTLVLPNTIISIGAHAFNGASYLQTIHFGSVLEEIGEYAFNGCVRVKQMTCLAEITPNVGTDGLTSISDLAELYVPYDYLFDYQIDNNWKRFQLKTIGATETTVETQDVAIVADDNTATFTWPTSNTADSYTIEITKDGVVFCRLIFNANGQLTGIAFAPSRYGQSMAPAATMATNGLQFTVTGLNSSTSYGFSLEAKNGETTVASYSGSFRTTGASGITTAIDDIESSAMHNGQKFLRNGKLFILRNGKTYTIQGQEVR